jgi:hypothetical protein
VYAEPGPDGRLRRRPASQSGFEGVACVDDAARAAILLGAIWRRRGERQAVIDARGYLAFVCGMQGADGRFANFIRDWCGDRNLSGPTSHSGGRWWTARALHALAVGYATFRDPAYATAFHKGLPTLPAPTAGGGAAGVAALAALTFWRATGERAAADALGEYVDLIVRCRRGDALVDEADEDPTHLWGRYQEEALVGAGMFAGRPDLVEIARASADAVLVPAVEVLPIRAPTLPYEVSRVIRGLRAVAVGTGLTRYAELAARGRDWFAGANPVGLPIHDVAADRAYDGVDRDGQRFTRSRNAGAEANIEAGLALLSG